MDNIILSCEAVYYAVQGSSNFWVEMNRNCQKAIVQCFPAVLFIFLYKLILSLESVNDKILECDPLK